MNFKFRAATKEDCKDISRLILDLAVYVKMPEQVKTSPEELERDGFCQNPFFECLVAEVPEEHKSKEGRGIGKGLLCKVAEVGKNKQCARLELTVFDWNTPSRKFYAAKGAQDLTESEGWHFLRFDKQSMDNLANEAAKD
ncbi:thialysine N-epsilon-acetyltransferase-like [Epinephelus fuscoguttatus]|uniref:thialysine N-epsilon-acetyltransferase-like n=1 Tax=Epinephelus fuscoguttatus TaxID=293821 RepID=UPI0020D066B7|nr:thialysine N-epsilon-acetyltransferase-like [Epinephelus fuscoguttatus]